MSDVDFGSEMKMDPKNWLMYEYMLAVLVWLLAGAAVVLRV